MPFWTLKTFAVVTDGRWLTPPADEDAPITGLSIDSRELPAGSAFLALSGEKSDAHDYLPKVAETEAALAIVADADKSASVAEAHPGLPMLLVDDALTALQTLADSYRTFLSKNNCKVIAVAGSNGKTTTRHLIHTALNGAPHPDGRTLVGTQSPKSFNNHIGVPLTLLAARPEHDFVVAEAGTNHHGELDALGKILRPDAVVMTSIGEEHLEFFENLDGVAREEARMLHYIAGDGPAFIEDQAYSAIESVRGVPEGLNVQRYGDEMAMPDAALTILGQGVHFDGERQCFRVSGGLGIKLPLLGKHNAVNALAAIAVGRWLGVGDPALAEQLAEATPVDGRLQVLRYGPITVINDAYNANPDSVADALITLTGLPGRRVVVLGDMLELGESGPRCHQQLGTQLAQLARDGAIAKAVLVGTLSMHTAETLDQAWPQGDVCAYPEWDDHLPGELAAALEPGDVVLLKASRGIQLERVLPAIENRFAKTHA